MIPDILKTEKIGQCDKIANWVLTCELSFWYSVHWHWRNIDYAPQIRRGDRLVPKKKDRL